jgi:hypothetical protein
VKAGPKTAVDGSPLPLRGSRRCELAVARFATDDVRVPRGHGVRKPLRGSALVMWQQRPGQVEDAPAMAESTGPLPCAVTRSGFSRMAPGVDLPPPR